MGGSYLCLSMMDDSDKGRELKTSTLDLSSILKERQQNIPCFSWLRRGSCSSVSVVCSLTQAVPDPIWKSLSSPAAPNAAEPEVCSPQPNRSPSPQTPLVAKSEAKKRDKDAATPPPFTPELFVGNGKTAVLPQSIESQEAESQDALGSFLSPSLLTPGASFKTPSSSDKQFLSRTSSPNDVILHSHISARTRA